MPIDFPCARLRARHHQFGVVAPTKCPRRALRCVLSRSERETKGKIFRRLYRLSGSTLHARHAHLRCRTLYGAGGVVEEELGGVNVNGFSYPRFGHCAQIRDGLAYCFTTHSAAVRLFVACIESFATTLSIHPDRNARQTAIRSQHCRCRRQCSLYATHNMHAGKSPSFLGNVLANVCRHKTIDTCLWNGHYTFCAASPDAVREMRMCVVGAYARRTFE